MSEIQENKEEPFFTIDITDLCKLNQEELDEIKYLDAPDSVWIAVQQDLEQIPPLVPVVQKKKIVTKEVQNEDRFLDISEQDLDDIASENSAANTKNQTKWALKTF